MPQVKLLDPSDPRRRLDRYELIGEIASGGMASVFLARLGGVGGFQRFYAIKRLHPHLASEAEFIQMFLDEARLAAGIHHPHVVPILEVGTTEAGYYLVMEYIEGDTLARVLARAASARKPVPRPIVVRALLDALAGLHAAHELVDPAGHSVQLVHRDCSPQNILVGVDGCTRITDFGVARATSRLATTRSDRMKGKLAYMSPEQTKGGDLDRRSDLFAMGAVLWEALAGRRLFKGDSEGATLSRVMAERIPRLREALPDAPAALDAVCARALERDPARRYQTAAEMADALERAAREALPEGVASSREVAAYVQQLLGQEIAAQREGVRVWLQHESSAAESQARPRVTPIHPDFAPAPEAPAAEPAAKILPVVLPEASPSDPVAREPSMTPNAVTVSARASLVPAAPVRRSRGLVPIVGVALAVALLGGGAALWAVLRRGTAETSAAAPVAAAVTATATATVTAAAAPEAAPEAAPAIAAASASAIATASASASASAAVPAPASAAVPASAPATAVAPAPAQPAVPRRAPAVSAAPKPLAPASDMANPYR